MSDCATGAPCPLESQHLRPECVGAPYPLSECGYFTARHRYQRAGTFTINADVGFNPAVARTYPERLSVRVGAVDFLMKGHFIGMFVQDHWKLNNRLTVNLGARYDIEVLPTPNEENPLFSEPDSYPMDLNNVSPRLGFALSLIRVP